MTEITNNCHVGHFLHFLLIFRIEDEVLLCELGS